MGNKTVTIGQKKKIALVAHDNKKANLLEWVKFNRNLLLQHELFATGTTGKMLEKELNAKITKLQSGPLGGDQQIGAKIAEGTIDFSHLLLGSSRTPSSRSRCKGPLAHGRGMEHTCGLQSRIC